MTGAEVREWRRRRVLTQQELADLIGMSRQCVQHWENHDSVVPKPAETLMYLIDTIRGAKRAVEQANKLRERNQLSQAWQASIQAQQQRAA